MLQIWAARAHISTSCFSSSSRISNAASHFACADFTRVITDSHLPVEPVGTSAAAAEDRPPAVLGTGPCWGMYIHTHTTVGEIVRPIVGSAWCVTFTSPWEREVYTPSRADDRPNKPTNIGWYINTRPPPGCWHRGRKPIGARRAWCGGPYYGTALRC